MNYTIENDFLRVEISDLGAQIMSIVGKKTNTEYLWQGHPAFWANRASVLFPICGRLWEGKYTWNGQTYEMPLHGFVKNTPMAVTERRADRITFECAATEKTRAMYPFSFVFRMTFTLSGNTVENRFTVVNTGEGELPFSLGGHPGFNVPFAPGEQFEDYYLEFEEITPIKALELSPRCFWLGTAAPFALREGKYLDLRHDLFDNDAVFFADMANGVTLRSKKNDRAVTVRYADMTHVGLWHAPHTAAPYVCIEPWHGVPAIDGKVDDFAAKNEFLHLPAGETYETWFSISVTE